jgi:hypothetical protein
MGRGSGEGDYVPATPYNGVIIYIETHRKALFDFVVAVPNSSSRVRLGRFLLASTSRLCRLHGPLKEGTKIP